MDQKVQEHLLQRFGVSDDGGGQKPAQNAGFPLTGI
jgi:hypothetical protein